MGKAKTDVNFVNINGRTLSQRISFHENGKISQEGMFGIGNGWRWNIPVGKIKNYFEDGILESELIYNDYGALDGECLYFDRKGQLIKKIKYANDKVIQETFAEKATDRK